MRESEAPLCEAMEFTEMMRLSDMMGIPLNLRSDCGLAREFDQFLRFFGLSLSQGGCEPLRSTIITAGRSARARVAACADRARLDRHGLDAPLRN